MNDTPFEPGHAERLNEGGTWLLDLVSAVDHLQRGFRPGFTVWDALDEAIRHDLLPHPPDLDEGAASPVDPLAESLGHLAQCGNTATVAELLQQAVRRWVVSIALQCNDGGWWPHPQPRRTFPPPLIDPDNNEALDAGA